MKVLILSSSDGIALTLMRCLGLGSEQPIECFLFSIWPSLGFARHSRFCKEAALFEVANFSKARIDRAIDAINDHCDRWSIDVIVPAGLWGTYFISLFQERLRVKCFPVPESATFRQLNDKGCFSELMQQIEVSIPPTLRLEAMDPDYKSWPYPLVIKPTCAGHSMGVQILSSPEDFQAYQADMDSQRRFILQDFIEGFDLAFGFIAEHGVIKASTLHRKMSGKVSLFCDEELLEMIQKIITATGYHGVGNFDIRWDYRQQRFLIIECNPRFWGNVGISRYFGVDFIGLGFAMVGLESSATPAVTGAHEPIVLPYPNLVHCLGTTRTKVSNALPGYLPAIAWRELLDPWPTFFERRLRFLKVRALDDNPMIHPAEGLPDSESALLVYRRKAVTPGNSISEYVP